MLRPFTPRALTLRWIFSLTVTVCACALGCGWMLRTPFVNSRLGEEEGRVASLDQPRISDAFMCFLRVTRPVHWPPTSSWCRCERAHTDTHARTRTHAPASYLFMEGSESLHVLALLGLRLPPEPPEPTREATFALSTGSTTGLLDGVRRAWMAGLWGTLSAGGGFFFFFATFFFLPFPFTIFFVICGCVGGSASVSPVCCVPPMLICDAELSGVRGMSHAPSPREEAGECKSYSPRLDVGEC